MTLNTDKINKDIIALEETVVHETKDLKAENYGFSRELDRH